MEKVKLVVDLLFEMKNAKGKLKLEALKDFYDQHKDDTVIETLKKVVEYTYDKQKSFHTKSVNHAVIGTNIFDNLLDEKNYFPIDNFFKALDNLNAKGSCSSADQAQLDSIFQNISGDAKTLAGKIINRDLDIGASLSTFRKVFGKSFVPDYPFQKASSYDIKKIEKNITFPARSELKSDGAAAIAHFNADGDCLKVMTGNGREIHSNALRNGLKAIITDSGGRLRGELLVLNEDGSIMERAKGNGIINKAIKGTIGEDDDSRLLFVVWEWYTEEDVKNEKSETLYSEVIDIVDKCVILTGDDTILRNIEGKTVNSMKEAKEHFIEMIGRGEEGTIVKDLDSKWTTGRNKQQYKFKVEETTELICTGTTPHTKKPGCIGSLICESSDGVIKVKLGSGLKKVDIEKEPSEFIGKIIEAKFNNITDVRSDGSRSLFLPRFVEVREDKDTAHSSKYIIDSFNNSIGLKLIK